MAQLYSGPEGTDVTDAPAERDEEGAWSKLRRRKVVQWGLAYAAGGWALLQVFGFAADSFNWPTLTKQLAMLGFGLGLPAAIVLAWYHGDRGQQRVTAPELGLLTLLALAGGSVFWLYAQRGGQATVTAVSTPYPAPAARPVAPPERSVAVLPFVDMSERHDQGYFSDGLSEELIDMLTKVPALRVPARTSSFYFKDKQSTIAEIGSALNVAHVLEGSVRKSGNTLRITVQLIRVDTGYHVWSETYDRKVEDIFRIQDDIAKAVVNGLKLSLVGGTVPRAPYTVNSDAYLLYLQAQESHFRATTDGSRQAVKYLRQALKLDPGFAQGWATLAGFLAADYNLFDPQPLEAVRAQIYTALDRARNLDPNLPLIDVVTGRVLYEVDHDWPAAETAIKQALALAPGNSEAHRLAAYLAITSGRFDEGIEQTDKAVELDPLQPWNYVVKGYATYRSGRLADAEANYRIALKLAPAAGKFHFLLGTVMVVRGQPDAALAEMDKESDPRFRRVGTALALEALGRRDAADKELTVAEQKVGDEMSYWIAMTYAVRRDPDRAFAWLDRALRNHGDGVLWIKGDPLMNGLVTDPRYKAFLQKMKLPV